MKKAILLQVCLALAAFTFMGNVWAQNRDVEQVKQQIQHLREMAREAMERGQKEQAKEFMEKAEDLLVELRENSDQEERDDDYGELEELMTEAEEAEREGDYERAEELWQEAQELKRQLHKRPKHAKEGRRPRRGDMRPPHENRRGDRRGYKNNPRVKKVLEFLKEFEPQRLDELKELERENPDQFFRELKECAREMRELENLKREQPEHFQEVMNIRKLNAESWKFAEAYLREKDFAKRTEIKQKLQGTLNQIFELKIKAHEKEIALISQELERLKKKIAKRTEKKERIIEKRLKEMIGEDDEFEWED